MTRSCILGVVAALVMTVYSARANPPAREESGWFLSIDELPKEVRLRHGVKRIEGDFGAALEFTNALQYAEVDHPRKLDGIDSATIGGWFFPRRAGEQSFFFRGLPEVAPQGERLFPPNDKWVNFVLGTDQRGFLLGALNGNGSMPFPLVTLNDVPINEWSQLVLVKGVDGSQRFYRNGTLVHSDRDSCWAVVANGPVSDFLNHGQHWAVPKGGGASQSLPGMRPFVLDRTQRIPVTFYEFTSLIAPRPLLVGQAVGERRPMEEENHVAVSQVYDALGERGKARYVWYPGDHDFPPAMQREAVEWFKRWLGDGTRR